MIENSSSIYSNKLHECKSTMASYNEDTVKMTVSNNCQFVCAHNAFVDSKNDLIELN